MRRVLIVVCLLLGVGNLPLNASELFHFNFQGWEKLPKLNRLPLYSNGHKAYVDIHVNEKAAKAYRGQKMLFPVGSRIFKILFKDKQGRYPVRLTVMIKMPPGYDTANGDWWYGVYNPEGSEAWQQGRIHSCIACHQLAKKTDYLFSQSVMADIKMQGESASELGGD